MSLPLEGVRVLDLTRLLPGPYATLALADLGADVVKLEDPGPGDYLRGLPPAVGPYGAAFAYLNRGKRAIVLDLKHPGGRRVARRLGRWATVLVESFRPGVMAALGLGWTDLREENPGLVYCSITGYGQQGPLSGRAGHDLDYVALAGLLSLAGRDGEPPAVPGVPVADLAGGGLWAAVSILAALREAERTGTGQHLDVSMTAGTMAFLGVHGAAALASGKPAGRDDSLLSGDHPAYAIYRCADGEWLAVAALEGKFWARLLAALGLEATEDALALPPCEWADVKSRLQETFSRRSRPEWLEALGPLDCCVEPLLELPAAFEHPQAHARAAACEVAVAGGGTVRQPAFPVVFSKTPVRPAGPAPTRGQHTHEFLLEAGFSQPELAELKAAGAFGGD